jgi:hypothetical protein
MGSPARRHERRRHKKEETHNSYMAFTQKMTRDYIDHMILINYIITLPHHSTCTISTDSANCISTYQQRLNSPTLSPRRQLKQTNFLIWNLIFWLIHHRNIT